MYPPLGKAGGTLSDSDVIYISDGTTKAKPVDVLTQSYTVAGGQQKTPVHSSAGTTAAAMSEEEQIKYLEQQERKKKLKILTERLQQKVDVLNSAIEGFDSDSKGEDLISQSKAFLEDNSAKIKKQTLILESEMEELQEGIEFIKKNKDREINIVSILFLTNSEIGQY